MWSFRVGDYALSPALKRCEQLYQRLDDQLSQQPWLSGNTLGLADIPAGTTLYRYFEMEGISRPELPNVRRWYQQLQARHAYQQQVMRPFGELKGRLAY
ncbi:glutathione S-transferase C-terminal domain-containing protein [Kushneria aurantia]|uniref:Glutathione S-transferase C-terminal domain-containing protein n=1 Tax=Kushneria aurantia TaxID=504092 RepID=A0ABV6FZU5_9GAMM